MAPAASIASGIPPTPLEIIPKLSGRLGRRVWIKREDLTSSIYGGNKVRKLIYLLRDAKSKGATDLLTFGPIGSHHVLATTVHGIQAGFEVHAVVIPGPNDVKTADSYRAALDLGCHFSHAATQNQAGLVMAKLLAAKSGDRRPYLILPGGTSPLGGVGMLDAIDEVAQQLGDAPWPSHGFCAVGSGGTYAGLIAELHLLDSPMKMLGVAIREGWSVQPWYLNQLARLTLKAAGKARPPRGMLERFSIIDRPCGREYAAPCQKAQEAMQIFAEDGLELDPTYSGKTAAAMLEFAQHDRGDGDYLFWQTYAPNRL